MEAATHRDILVSPCSPSGARHEGSSCLLSVRLLTAGCALATLDTVPRFQTPYPEIPRRVAASAFEKDRPNRQAGCRRRDLGGGRSRDQGAAAKIGTHGLGRGRIAPEVVR